MADKIRILTQRQEDFLNFVGEDKNFRNPFYFTGGTPLAAFYLFHRLSEDIDLFSEEEVNILGVQSFIGKAQKRLGIKRVDYKQYYGLHTFQLYFSAGDILKVDFNYYPFPRIEKGIVYKDINVDSALDIAVNKVHTIAMKPRARDFIDIYFLIKEKGYTLKDLLMKAKVKFDWHIDALQLGTSLLQAREVKDFPRMIRNIDDKEWQNFFIEEARKLSPEIIQ